MYKDGSKCPICGIGTLKEEIVDEIFEYKGKKCTVPDYVIHVCSSCEEEFVSNRTIKKAQKFIVDFQKSVDGLLTSEEIRRIREKTGLTQKQMGNIFGGGEKSFARYENATLKQSKAMDNLLRVLAEDPFFVKEVLSGKTFKGEPIVTESISYNVSMNNEDYDLQEYPIAAGF